MKFVPADIDSKEFSLLKEPTYQFYVWDRHLVKETGKGVYVFYDKEGLAVYIGSSKDLKKRAVNEHLAGEGDPSYTYFYYCEIYDFQCLAYVYEYIEKAWQYKMKPPLCKELNLKPKYRDSNMKNILTVIEQLAVRWSKNLKGINPKELVVLLATIEQADFDNLIDLKGLSREGKVYEYLKKIKWGAMSKENRNMLIQAFESALFTRLQLPSYDIFEEEIAKVAFKTGNIDDFINTNDLSTINSEELEDYKSFIHRMNS